MKIHKCHIKNFTVFLEESIEFCEGVNVLIGTNGTGKSHLLKLLYSMVQTMPAQTEPVRNDADIFRLYGTLNGVFKPEDGEVNSMIRSSDRKTPAVFQLKSDLGHHYAELRRDYHIGAVNVTVGQTGVRPWQPFYLDSTPGLFIPPNEVLAIYPGFVASYEKRELAFDQTYYDLCKFLAAAPLKQNSLLSPMKDTLEEILEGSVIQKGDRFYVKHKKTERTLEAHLLAEGHRKIATLIHLINNGSIDKNTILFWDEPESNLNPRLIKHIASLLRDLAHQGVQVFIATHDYLLTGELSLAAEYKQQPEVPIRFFGMNKSEDGSVRIETGETLPDIQNNPILDEFAEHYQREQDAAIEYMKRGTA